MCYYEAVDWNWVEWSGWRVCFFPCRACGSPNWCLGCIDSQIQIQIYQWWWSRFWPPTTLGDLAALGFKCWIHQIKLLEITMPQRWFMSHGHCWMFELNLRSAQHSRTCCCPLMKRHCFRWCWRHRRWAVVLLDNIYIYYMLLLNRLRSSLTRCRRMSSLKSIFKLLKTERLE